MDAVKHSSRSGFSILELAVVLAVIALILGSALAVGATRIQAAKIQDTDTKLKAIMDTLDLFVQTYGYLPCPADPQVPYADTTPAGDTAFGDGVANATTGGCAASNLIINGNYAIGVVPTTTLNLAPAVMMDGWNHRITYAIDTRFTTAAGYANGAGQTPPYLIINMNGTQVTNQAVVVIVSYGPDGHGAWKAKGGSTTVVADPVPTDADELENANNGNNIFVQKFNTETFDDMVAYKTQWQFPCTNITSITNNPFQCK